MSALTTGSRRHVTKVHTRKPEADLTEIIHQTSELSITERTKRDYRRIFNNWVAPLLILSVSAYVRVYGIDRAYKVVWDEAHFGKFGSHYLKHEFYFDVHPPLGKLLVALLGYLAGYDGLFTFESGNAYPMNDRSFYKMRLFNCAFGILCAPLAYWTARELNFSLLTTWLVALSVAFEMLSLTLSKFILLDLMLLFFTVSTFFGLTKYHSLRRGNQLLSLKGIFWLAFTGASIGCVCSVKWVGLFITILVGLYTVYDLTVRLFEVVAAQSTQEKFPFSLWVTYIYHWIVRIVTLILIPFAIYVLAFAAHFKVLSASGPGDGSISTLLQASLSGNKLQNGPRSIAFGLLVTLRSQGLSPNLLHSHGHVYPLGSQQQQITTYGFKDNNNEFLVEFGFETQRDEGKYATLDFDEKNPDYILDYKTLVKDGDTIRLMHKESGAFLHSHAISARVLKNAYEASGYGGLDILDPKDDWVVEIQSQYESPSPEFQNEADDEVHPVSTNFRLRHKVLGCYLATTGYSYPAWGFQQGEVVCKYSLFAGDKGTWWNVEDHVNKELETPSTQYVAPKPRFWKEFILLNYGMMASNNALIPDPDHYDHLASSWWEWPILRVGLRMSGWSPIEYRYFLMGHPFVTYLLTACIPLAVLFMAWTMILWRRQKIDLSVDGENWGFFVSAGILPIMGWVLHYLPFIVMGRVTYLHHYVPALYLAIFVTGYLVENVARRMPTSIRYILFALLYVGVVGGFIYYLPLSLGMTGPVEEYNRIRLLKSWKI